MVEDLESHAIQQHSHEGIFFHPTMANGSSKKWHWWPFLALVGDA
jgi:hypothetical protein